MRRSFIVAVLLCVAAVGVAAAVGARAAGPDSGKRGSLVHHGRVGWFAVACRFSHRNQDDPIVFPGRRPLPRPHVLRQQIHQRILDACLASQGRPDDVRPR
jgi:hypothetical protein